MVERRRTSYPERVGAEAVRGEPARDGAALQRLLHLLPAHRRPVRPAAQRQVALRASPEPLRE
eukprot:6668157-Lingulodinium_polyedra.AAC.1